MHVCDCTTYNLHSFWSLFTAISYRLELNRSVGRSVGRSVAGFAVAIYELTLRPAGESRYKRVEATAVAFQLKAWAKAAPVWLDRYVMH